ncbi:MAG TPA: hypothetical protein VI754_14720 [Bacteriovoracaceae bacterium]|nr:hypothetical protein [Bacteriovoracaceae bacterium]
MKQIIVAIVIVSAGLRAEASISLVSADGWDCLYNASFYIDLSRNGCTLYR